ncbi:HU family DNA-binding protein [Haliea sp.]|jgi:nucleoid DNA-binding protein|uniref:HU family DNA-binding protein n=1 Tax=Haliea sp. TaxID=1932666 RepID=UPI000C492845|nr:HU family DNA-binding protein [Haliea sp.]MAD65677.1 DNA-binding protein [Haliea sp.]|tara:strand:+ start:10338 stop:10601 length:264 start_codon:yes stop_codon:yes gene_type:complete
MNKAELIEKIAQSADLTKAQATKTLNATTEAITEALKSGEQVQLVNFATFKVSHRPERKGRNPRSGESITIAAANVPTAKMSKNLLS